MKQLIVLRGTMGAGKTAICQHLLQQLAPAVWLDGDWCWNMAPFVPNEENKGMVMDNIAHLLRNFLNNSTLQNVIFCWVLHEESILQDLLARLGPKDYELHVFTLDVTPEALERRLQKDVEQGLRQPDVIQRSLARLPLYAALGGQHIDVSQISPQEAARQIGRARARGHNGQHHRHSRTNGASRPR